MFYSPRACDVISHSYMTTFIFQAYSCLPKLKGLRKICLNANVVRCSFFVQNLLSKIFECCAGLCCNETTNVSGSNDTTRKKHIATFCLKAKPNCEGVLDYEYCALVKYWFDNATTNFSCAIIPTWTWIGGASMHCAWNRIITISCPISQVNTSVDSRSRSHRCFSSTQGN